MPNLFRHLEKGELYQFITQPERRFGFLGRRRKLYISNESY